MEKVQGSADHLMKIDGEGMSIYQDTICILCTGYLLFRQRYIYTYKKIRDANIQVALATDFNAGGCYIKSIPFIFLFALLSMSILNSTFNLQNHYY